MRLGKTICLVGTAILFAVSADQCLAQLGRIHQPVQRTGRFFGLGYGVGYHHCNPGPDTSYYNAWSSLNSRLIHRTPEYQARYGHQDRDAWQMLYSGSRHYSHGYNPGMQQMQGVQPMAPVTVDAQFEPIPNPSRTGAQRKDFVSPTPPGDTDSDDEDSFDDVYDGEEDVDAFRRMEDEAGVADPDAEGGSGSQASPSDDRDGEVSLETDSIFLGAIHPRK